MSKNIKSIAFNTLFNLAFWISFFTFIMTCRYYEIGKIAFVNVDIVIPVSRILANGFAQGFLVGIFYTIMEYYLKDKGIYNYSLSRIIINRTAIQFVISVIVISTLAYMNYYYDNKYHNIENSVGFDVYITSATVKLLIVAALAGNVFLSVFRALQMKVGEEIFWQLLIGKYKPAREEDKTFLFIDLKSSTAIAEKLGHIKYSFFIQDCFRDLHPAVIITKAQIYQYVGDEAVLTWDTSDAVENNHCVKAYFEFEYQLLKRSKYYLRTYGVIPVFKAGLNCGKVMTAEVGVIKRDIAYHSDVLNTAARIQSQCNEKGAKLLASEIIAQKLDLNSFETIDRGEIELRGKNEKVRVYEINLPKDEFELFGKIPDRTHDNNT